MTSDGARRWREQFVALDGCFNFRDLGGYATTTGQSVRQGMLYRSDGLHRLSSAGRDAFLALGVTTVIDLRTPGEVTERAWQPPAEWPGQWLHLPLRGSTPDWTTYEPAQRDAEEFAAAHYLETVAEAPAAVKAVIEVLAEPGRMPAVFHCAAGKDRTGIIAGLVLALLDVPANTVADDYALSDVATQRWEASIAAGARDDTQTGWGYVPPAMLDADRRTMMTFLSCIEMTYGSIERFAISIGVADTTISRLRRSLLA